MTSKNTIQRHYTSAVESYDTPDCGISFPDNFSNLVKPTPFKSYKSNDSTPTTDSGSPHFESLSRYQLECDCPASPGLYDRRALSDSGQFKIMITPADSGELSSRGILKDKRESRFTREDEKRSSSNSKSTGKNVTIMVEKKTKAKFVASSLRNEY